MAGSQSATLVWGSEKSEGTVSIDEFGEACLAACPADPVEAGEPLTACQISVVESNERAPEPTE